jgi:hypothetical protein
VRQQRRVAPMPAMRDLPAEPSAGETRIRSP